MSSGSADPSFQLTMSDWTPRVSVGGHIDRLSWATVIDSPKSCLRSNPPPRTSPREWGDPLRALPGLRLVQFRRVYEDLSVVYSVHEIHRIVWLGSVTPLRQSPLWIGEG